MNIHILALTVMVVTAVQIFYETNELRELNTFAVANEWRSIETHLWLERIRWLTTRYDLLLMLQLWRHLYIHFEHFIRLPSTFAHNTPSTHDLCVR